jgi:WD40 repeat protein
MSLLATCSQDCTLLVFEVASSKKIGEAVHGQPVTCCSFSKNGKYIVTGCQDGVCRLWTSKKKNQSTPMTSYFGQKVLTTCISFQPNGEIVASGSGDGSIHLWSASTAKSIHALVKVHRAPVLSVCFDASGTMVLSVDTKALCVTCAKSGASLYLLEAASLKPNLFFTATGFAPQRTFPNYFFLCNSERQVQFYEFKITNAETEASGKSKKQNIPSVSITCTSEIYSFQTKFKVSCVATGPDASMAFGDLGGNISIVRFIPRSPELAPEGKTSTKSAKPIDAPE